MSFGLYRLVAVGGILTCHREMLDESRGRPQLSDLLGYFLNHIHKFGSFSRGNPGEMEATWFYAEMFN
jgi:hypothetical protein